MRDPMKQVVVLSGKGGTGKTLLIASFISLTRDCVICDCDVDAADLHLLLDPEIIKEEDFCTLEQAEIDRKVCIQCGLCEEHCRFLAIKDCRVDPMKCEGCGVCQLVCPLNAVTTHPKSVGKVFTSRTRYGAFIHGRLNPGSSNSGKMVTRIRQIAEREAEKQQADIILIDGSPGIGCPVISSVTGSDMVLVVTEPTLSGIHDMERVIALTEHFGIECSVIVNKYDINESNVEKIENFCSEHCVPITGKIPYNRIFTEAIIVAKPLVEFTQNGVSRYVEHAWRRSCELLWKDMRNEERNRNP